MKDKKYSKVLPDLDETVNLAKPRCHPRGSLLIPTPRTSTGFRYRFKDVWKRAMFKIKTKNVLRKMRNDLLLYGTSHHVLDMNNQFRNDIKGIFEKKRNYEITFAHKDTKEKSNSWIISSNSRPLGAWNAILFVMILYVAIMMPYRLAFIQTVYWDTWTLVETIIDVLFMIDLILNFFIWPSHIDSNESKSLKSIAINYLTGWFLVDLISSIPIGLINYSLGIEDSAKFTKYNKLLRMTRIPRLSRVFRIFRLIKVLKHQQTSKFLLKLLEFLQVNARIVKFFEFLFMVFLFVHCLGCFWYFSAVIDEFSPETWVVRNGLQDVPPEQLYLTCIYWALTTITTVGYGDIAARTDLEKVTAMILMICGVGFYSFTIGSLSSFLLNVESRETLLTQKMAAINEFAKETQVTDEVRKKIRQAIRFRNSKVGIVWSDKHSLFKELPKGLQFEVALSMYSGLAKESILFKDRDPALTTALIPTLFPLKVNRGEYLYQKGDYSDSLYLIATGRVSLVTEQFGIAYKSYLKGSYFGEIELFDGCLREENVVTVLNSEFFTITRNEFLRVLNDFPADKDRIFSVALKKKEKNAECRNEIVKLIRFWSKEGSVAALAGKSAEMIDDVTVVYKNDIEEQSRLTDESSEISQINDRLDRIEKCMQMILERLDGLK